MAIQHLLCTHFGQRKVVVFAEDSTFGINAASDMFDESYCKLDLLREYVVDVGSSNINDDITSAKATGANIFVIFANAELTGLIMKTGYYADLFTEGKLID